MSRCSQARLGEYAHFFLPGQLRPGVMDRRRTGWADHHYRNQDHPSSASSHIAGLLKGHSRCNPACAYCYSYKHSDQGWRGQPEVMSHETAHHPTGDYQLPNRQATPSGQHQLPERQAIRPMTSHHRYTLFRGAMVATARRGPGGSLESP